MKVSMRPISALHTQLLLAMHATFSLFSLTSASAPYSVVVFGEPLPGRFYGSHLAVAHARSPITAGSRLVAELRERAHLIEGWRLPLQHGFIFEHAGDGLHVVGWSNGRWSAGSILNMHHPEVPPTISLLNWGSSPIAVFPLLAASLDSIIDLSAHLPALEEGTPCPEE